MRGPRGAAQGVGPLRATSRGVGQSPTEVKFGQPVQEGPFANGPGRATMLGPRGAAQGVGPLRATSRGVGQSPTEVKFGA